MKTIESRNQREDLYVGRTSREDERRYVGTSKRHFSRLPAEYGGLKKNKSAEFAHTGSNHDEFEWADFYSQLD